MEHTSNKRTKRNATCKKDGCGTQAVPDQTWHAGMCPTCKHTCRGHGCSLRSLGKSVGWVNGYCRECRYKCRAPGCAAIKPDHPSTEWSKRGYCPECKLKCTRCGNTRAPEENWGGRTICRACKAAQSAKERLLTYDRWVHKVSKLQSEVPNEPQPHQFLNHAEYAEAHDHWETYHTPTYTCRQWADTHERRMRETGRGGYGNRAWLLDNPHKFVSPEEHQLAVQYWDQHQTATPSYQTTVCKHQGCHMLASFAGEDGKRRFCAAHKPQHAPRLSGTHCTAQGCTTQRSFGVPGGRTEYCATHAAGREGYIDLVSKRCEAHGCNIQAAYGGEDGKRRFCVAHKPEHAHRLSGTHCKSEGCTAQPFFGLPGGNPEYCATHALGREGYVDILSKRCDVEGCDTQSSYGKEGTLKRTHCARHGKELGLVDIKSMKCAHRGCAVIAAFAFPGKPREFCQAHKKAGMVNVVSPMCIEEGCECFAVYAIPGELPKWCHRHKIGHPGVLYTPRNKRCQCRRPATHGYYHHPARCDTCALPDDISLLEHQCADCGYVEPLSEKNLCEHCDTEWTPSERGQTARHVKRHLDAAAIPYNMERVVEGTGGLAPDFTILGANHALIVLEIDQEQHGNSRYTTSNARYNGSRDAETLRMKDICAAEARVKAFVRFNPDEYTSNVTQLNSDQRGRVLAAVLQKLIDNPPQSPTVTKLFYDGYVIPESEELFD